MNINIRGFSSLISILVIAGLVVVVGGYFLIKENGLDVPHENQIVNESGKSVTAYIVSIDKNTIVLDYVDALGGEDALRAMVEDGHCSTEEAEYDRNYSAGLISEEDYTLGTGCFPSVWIYDRNVNPQLRTFTLAPDVQVSMHGLPTATLEQLKQYGLAFERDGHRVGLLFAFTFNDMGQVSKIEYVFRP